MRLAIFSRGNNSHCWRDSLALHCVERNRCIEVQDRSRRIDWSEANAVKELQSEGRVVTSRVEVGDLGLVSVSNVQGVLKGVLKGSAVSERSQSNSPTFAMSRPLGIKDGCSIKNVVV